MKVFCYFTDSTLATINGTSPVSVQTWATANNAPYAEIDDSDARYVAWLAMVNTPAPDPIADLQQAVATLAANAGQTTNMPASIQAVVVSLSAGMATVETEST